MNTSRSRLVASCIAITTVLVLASAATGAAARKPNLTVPRMAVPAHLGLGSSKTIDVSVKNVGDAVAAGTTVKLTLSSTRTAGRVVLGSGRVTALGPGRSATVAVSVAVPGSAPMGNRFVVACVDPTARIVEGNDSDNCRAAATHVM